MPDDEQVCAVLRDDHADLLAAVTDSADAVAAAWDGDATTDRDAVVPPLRAALRERGALARAPAALEAAVDAAGLALPAEPVAAPPYVVVTSRGLLLRATRDGGRLVVTLVAFRVERNCDGSARYVRADDRLAVERR